MSKSKGNVVVPDEYIKLYGSDTLRTYLMFLGPFDGGGDFRDTGISGMYRWLSRVWRLVHETAKNSSEKSTTDSQAGMKLIAKTIAGVTRDMEQLHYNTAIAKFMEFTNWWMDQPNEVSKSTVISFLKLLAPFAPHMVEELFQFLKIKNDMEDFKSIHQEMWPTFDPELVKEERATIIIQINGKKRDSVIMEVQNGKIQNHVEQSARNSAKIKKWLYSNPIRKIIFVPGKLINFVL